MSERELFIERLLLAAQRHGVEADEDDMEVGDLQQLLYTMSDMLSDDAFEAFADSQVVGDVLDWEAIAGDPAAESDNVELTSDADDSDPFGGDDEEDD